MDAQSTLLASRNAEKEQLAADLDTLKQDNADLEAELSIKEASGAARRATGALTNGSPASSLDALQEEINHYRDKMASNLLELERKESEIEELLQDGDARDADHADELARLQKDWSDEYEDLKAHRDELEDVRLGASLISECI